MTQSRLAESGAPPSQARLEIQNLSVRYGAFQALKDISLQVGRGEIIGVIGPNGAGKSTFVRAICGHQPFDDGDIKVGKSAVSPRDVRPEHIGLVPQEIGLYSFLTAEENLFFFARAAALPAARTAPAVEQALAAVQMAEHRHKCVANLSGGMKRRINFAAAILAQPEVLILDEPTVGVDAAAQDALVSLALRQAAAGTAVVLISHDLKLVETLCARVIVLSRGTCRYFDTPAAILGAAFGQARELRLYLDGPVTPDLEAALRGNALVFSAEDECWTGWSSDDPSAASSGLYDVVEAAGGTVRELTIRKPGLETLIRQLTQETGA